MTKRRKRSFLDEVFAAWAKRGEGHTLHALGVAAGLSNPAAIYTIKRRGACSADSLERLCAAAGLELKEVR